MRGWQRTGWFNRVETIMPTQAKRIIEPVARNEECTEPVGPVAGKHVEQQEIAELAYELWQMRGCPDGSPEEDWFRAERELQNRR